MESKLDNQEGESVMEVEVGPGGARDICRWSTLKEGVCKLKVIARNGMLDVEIMWGLQLGKYEI